MMKSTTYAVVGLLALTLLVIPACDWFKKNETATVVAEPVLRIIDVNSSDVFNDAHIDGAVNVNLNDLAKVSEKWNKNDHIVVYCSGYQCMASHSAAKTLTDLGFTNAAVYAGGISEWYKLSKENKERYPLVGHAKMEFLGKEVEKVTPKKEEANIVSADELAQRLEQMKKTSLAA